MAVSSADKIYLSDEDQKKLAQYTAQWEEANKNNDEVGKRAAHDAAEKLRSNASVSYSGGSNGSGYTPNTTSEKFSYESAPSYVSKYADQIDSLYNAIVNRDAFSYDYTTDPLWSQYKKQYTREGQRATADTLGQYATMTGGMPSTAAVTAAQQAGDYYNAQMTDKIPELQQLAYSMYQNEGNDMYNQLNALQTMENNNYNRYLDDVNQYNTNRNYQYNLERDAIEDARYADELAYQRAQDEKEWNYKLAQAAKSTGSDKTSDKTSDNEYNTDSSTLFESASTYKDRGGNASDYIKQHYKEYGYSNQTSAIADYNMYVNGGGSLSYYPDEGIIIWNGKKYSDVGEFVNAVNSANLTNAETLGLQKKLKRYGLDQYIGMD